MNLIEQARKAVFGETWALPLAVTMLLGVSVAIKLIAPGAWTNLGGPLLLVGAVAALIVLVERGRPD